MKAVSSAIELIGESGATHSTNGVSAKPTTGTISLRTSSGISLNTLALPAVVTVDANSNVVPSGAARGRVEREVSGRPDLVFDDKMSAGELLQLLGVPAGQDVGAAAGREAEFDANNPVGIFGLGLRDSGERQRKTHKA